MIAQRLNHELGMDGIPEILGQLNSDEFSQSIYDAAGRKDLGPVLDQFRAMANAIQAQAQATSEKRLASVMNKIVDMADMKFGQPLEVGDDGSLLDAVISGLNMLSEELQHSVISKDHLDDCRGFLQSIIDGLPHPICTNDVHGKYTHCNYAMAKLLGKQNPKDVIGKSVYDLYSREIAQNLVEENMFHFETKAVDRREVLVPTSSGSRWFDSTIFPVIDSTGAVNEIGTSLVDVHESRELRDSLERSQLEMRILMDTVPEPISRTDRQGSYVYANRAYQTFVGVDPMTLIGSNQDESLPPHLYADMEPYVRLALAGEKVTYLLKNTIPTGGVAYVYTSHIPCFDSNGEVDGFVTMMVDLTKIKGAEERSLQEKRKFESLVNGLNQSAIVAVTDKAGTIQSVNDLFCKISGYSRDELIGANHRILKSEIHDQEFFRDMYRTIAGGQVWHGEVCNRRKDGSLYWVDTTITQVPAEGGKMHYMAIRFDITARHEAVRQLMASAKMSSLGEMAGGIAHEINNPLAIIQGKSKQLIKYANAGNLDPKVAAQELEKISSTTERIAKIVQGLRAFSRNADNDAVVPVDLTELMDNVMALCLERFRANGIRLDVNLDPGLTLECRSIQIEQVLINLLNNAFDVVSSLNEKWVRLDVSATDNMIRISVTDSGKGIPDNIVDKLMQPFFTTKDIGKGTGLGLSISKGLVEQHHGRFYFDASHPNTRFIVELPMKQDRPDPPSVTAVK